MKKLICICLIAFLTQGLQAKFETNSFPDSDTGTFYYYKDGIKIGSAYYEFLLKHVLTNSFELEMEGMSIKGQLKVEMNGSGNWEKVQYSVNGQKVDITNSGQEILLSADAREQSLPNESQGSVLEDMTPILLQLVLKKHAAKSSEIKEFKAYFIPAMNIIGEIEYLGKSEMVIGKKAGIFHRYRVNMPPIYETEIVTDSKDKICIIYYRAQNGAFVRAGYEELLDFHANSTSKH